MASVMSWVIMTVVRPSVRCSSRKSSPSASRVKGSSAPNGSSISTMRGRAASARATPTRWRWPPESSCGRRSRYCARSSLTRSSSSSTRVEISAGGAPVSFGVMPILSATVRCGNSPPPWHPSKQLGRNMTDTAQPAAVVLDDATVAFRVAGDRVYTAVERASLSVAHGEFVAIVGPTGCGKSTLLNVAAGLLKPAAGSVKIFDQPLTGLNREAGYLFQADALFPWKTAIDNVAIGLDIKGAPREQALQRAQGWLTSVGLGAFANRYPHMLSGGQRKRVGLAQVLIRDPKILLMDEPFGPLDAQTRQIMGNLLLELWNADRKAVLFVTHDLEEAIALADRVVIMSAGPAARIIGDWKVKLPRPRDIAEVRMEKQFHELHREIWSVLKDEVMKGYAQSSQAAEAV